jgi:hypothetical protein
MFSSDDWSSTPRKMPLSRTLAFISLFCSSFGEIFEFYALARKSKLRSFASLIREISGCLIALMSHALHISI